jgi:hypothetical protein
LLLKQHLLKVKPAKKKQQQPNYAISDTARACSTPTSTAAAGTSLLSNMGIAKCSASFAVVALVVTTYSFIEPNVQEKNVPK